MSLLLGERMKFTIFMHHFHMGYAMAFHYDICCLQHKVTCVAQYELISQTSDNEVVDHHGSINATVCWGRHSALLQEPPLDVIATLVTTIFAVFQSHTCYPCYLAFIHHKNMDYSIQR